MIRQCNDNDFNDIYEIINDAASAYKGIIPEDRWHEPYMSESELRAQISDGVVFSCYSSDNEIIGVMGIQDKEEVQLIRHAYVRTSKRNMGIGGIILKHLISSSEKPVLIGTWKDAVWAIDFYQKNGFSLVDDRSKNLLLKKFWGVPERQIETSVVLTDGKFDLSSL